MAWKMALAIAEMLIQDLTKISMNIGGADGGFKEEETLVAMMVIAAAQIIFADKS